MFSILVKKIIITDGNSFNDLLEDKGKVYTFLNPVSYLTALENKARELGCLETELSAQQQAQKFYEKLGYKPDGDMYYDEWCPHVTMKKIL